MLNWFARWRHKYEAHCTICACVVVLVFIILAFSLAPFRVRATQPPSQEAPDHGGQTYQQQSVPGWSDPVTILTAVLAAATAFLAGATYWQVKVSNREIGFTRRSFEREERMVFLQLHAAMRPGFVFSDDARSSVDINPQNRGLGQGALKAIWVRVSDETPKPPFIYNDQCKKRLTSLLLDPKEGMPFLFRDLITKPDEYLCGVLRWEDETKVGGNPRRWRYLFCMRVRRSPTEGFHMFHEWGTSQGWNREEPDPDEYTDEDS